MVQYIQILWTFDSLPVALTTRRSVLPLTVSGLFISWMCHRVLPSSTYLTQVYDDMDWWTSRYQTLGREILCYDLCWHRLIYVGIDIAKLNHFASAISSDGEVLIEPFKFTNASYSLRIVPWASVTVRMLPLAS